VKLVFSAQQGAIEQLVEEIEQTIESAAEGAVQDAARLAVKQGRANIAAAGGGFATSARWQRGFTYRFYDNDGRDPAALIFHRIGFASVFERGITISGRPLLWLPIERNLPAGITSPRQYGGKLVSVNIAGKPPLLFDAFNRLRGPLFFGTSSASIRKRFDLMNIIAAAAERMREFYDKRIKG
jgi:hypothetical protein